MLPKDEKYRLGDQMIRAARSATANIAEGYGRFHYLDTAKFVSNARGSVYEILDHLITAHDEGLLDVLFLQKGEELVEQAIRLLNGYIHYLQKSSRSAPAVKESSSDYIVLSPFCNVTNETNDPSAASLNETNATDETSHPSQ